MSLQVSNLQGTQVGMITKKYGNFIVEEFTDADTFAVQFPVDLDIKYKAVLIGASLLIVSIKIKHIYLRFFQHSKTNRIRSNWWTNF